MMLSIKIPPHIEKVLSVLHADGHKAYAVGGCIRDSIMGRNPYDWDVTTSALPEQTMNCFSEYKMIDSGLKHGTVAVIIGKEVVEITTFRTESTYSDNRHPDKVSFVKDVKDDLSRRDFTVNAMAYNYEEGLIDPFGGMEDIEKRIIRCVGKAEKRFSEDALRIMRAVRFSSVLDFSIEKETAECIHNQKHLINNVSVERINTELSKLLCGKNVFNVLMEFSDVIFTVIPELKQTFNVSQKCKHHIYNVWEHICVTVREIEPELDLRLTMLLHDIAKPLMKTVDADGSEHFKNHAAPGAEIAEQILRRLRYSNKTVSEVKELVLHHDEWLYERPKKIPLYVSRLGFDFLYKLDKISRADIKAQNPKYFDKLELCDKFLIELDRLKNSNLCLTLKDLQVNGKDLEDIGYKGKDIGIKLNELLEDVILGKISNDRQTLLQKAKSDITNNS